MRTGEYIQAQRRQSEKSCRQLERTTSNALFIQEMNGCPVSQMETCMKASDMQTLLDKGCKKQKLRAHSELLSQRAVNEWALTFLPNLTYK